MAQRYRVLDHTADTGIETRGPDLGAAVANAAFGMFDLMFDLAQLHPAGDVEIEVSAATVEDLVVDCLAELLFRAEADDLVFCEFRALAAGPEAVRLVAGAVPAPGAVLHGPPIKAVTYHGLEVEHLTAEGWRIRVIFDV